MYNGRFGKGLLGSLLILLGSLSCVNNNPESYRVESKPKEVENFKKVESEKEMNEKYTLIISNRKPLFIITPKTKDLKTVRKLVLYGTRKKTQSYY